MGWIIFVVEHHQFVNRIGLGLGKLILGLGDGLEINGSRQCHHDRQPGGVHGGFGFADGHAVQSEHLNGASWIDVAQGNAFRGDHHIGVGRAGSGQVSGSLRSMSEQVPGALRAAGVPGRGAVVPVVVVELWTVQLRVACTIPDPELVCAATQTVADFTRWATLDAVTVIIVP